MASIIEITNESSNLFRLLKAKGILANSKWGEVSQLENIEAIERRLWTAADTLRSNSELASNEYFLPVMGLIFLRHAYSRFLMVKEEIVNLD